MPEPRTTLRDAATVLLVRDAPRLQVLMLRRNLHSIFAGGAHVFPGGAVDPHDADPDVARRCRGLTEQAAAARLGFTQGALAFWVAAARECFEEAGVLLARHRHGDRPLDLTEPATADRFARHRAAVDAGDRRLVDVLDAEDLVLDAGRMHYLAHWVTPRGAPRRYDTRFFVAPAPAGQPARPDRREAIASAWMEPDEVLELERRGEVALIVPTLRTLEAIRRFATAADLLDAAARAVRPDGGVATVADLSGTRILLPGDDVDHGPAPAVAAGGSHE